MRALVSVSLLAAVMMTAIFSCNKKDGDGAAVNNSETAALRGSDRLLSVANVISRDNGAKTEVWFYETPLVHEFSMTATGAARFVQLLNEAKDNKTPVNVRVSAGAEDKIEAILTPTAEQVRTFNENRAKQEAAEAVPEPEAARTTLTAVIPNTTMLNNIWNSLRNECCALAGPYITGQCIPFQYVADGCYARAHKMRQIIEGTYGYTSYKVFNYADQCPISPGVLAVKASLWGNNCCVRWWYHVAPYVYVQSGTSQVAYLLDPSMHSGPVAISTWLNAQKNTSCGYTAGTVHKQAYYTSSAYAPSGYNFSTCTIQVYADNTYTAANSTCASYAPRKGCL